MTSIRSRWAAIGAAVAVTLGAGGVSLGQAAIGSGAKPVFVGITPCRLVDTRPGDNNVGGRTAPLSAGDTLSLQITGSTGQCTGIPAGAVAAAMNVTAMQGSTRSFLTLYPADAAFPNASNLNWNGGDPPTPNKVDVKLSSTGAVKITNNAGTVHVAADLVGYYIDHTHDDRYYTEDEVDAALTGKANAAGVYTKAELDSAIANKADSTNVYTKAQTDAALNTKANSSNVYTKAQTDAALNTKANSSNVYTKAQTDAALNTKANSSNVYTKAEVDARQPVAFGKLYTFDPTDTSRMVGVSSVVVNSVQKWYEFTLTDVYYSVGGTTVLTLFGGYGSCPANTSIREDSAGGKLLVHVLNQDGSFNGDCSFNFVSYAP